MYTKHHYSFILILFSFFVFSACSDDEESPQSATVNFANTEASISSSATSTVVEVVFSRTAAQAGSLSLAVNQGNLTYGEEADFYTAPAVVEGILTLNYEAGAEGVQFTLYAGNGLNIQEDETLVFTLNETSSDLIIGSNATVHVLFSENFIATSGTLTLDAGGDDFPYQAFVDLSKLTTTNIDKYSWDLGFHSGSGHHVVLNSSAYVMARSLDKTDLNSVTPEDTIGFGAVVSVPNYDPAAGASAWIDDESGDLSGTVFGEIAATASENKVFIIKRDGAGRNWKKIRVLQNGNGYTLEYADIDATTFTSVDIAKDDAFNFTFFDLDNGVATVEPEKDSWDISYGTYAIRYPFSGTTIPYGFNDYITINRHNTSIAIVMTEGGHTYEDFTRSQVETLEFISTINAVATSWRSSAGPGAPPAVASDRFFVLKDVQDNYYKIKFLSLTNDSGERGHATLAFELLP